ncbi:MAG: MauE/DoxX family redox-associated membrane protein [Vicinamibacterales bacterium]
MKRFHPNSLRYATVSRYIFGVLFILAGANHLLNPAVYVRIMPPYLPWHLSLVYISGVAEMALGALLLFRRWSAMAGWGLVALLAAIFPANLHMALHPELYRPIPAPALWLRLPMQAILMAWAYWYTRDDDRDFGETIRPAWWSRRRLR